MFDVQTSRRWLIALGPLAGVLVVVLYWPSLQFDLYADDFVSLRPWFPDAFWRSLTGTWLEFPDAPGFYRPVSTAYYALAFYFFGLNAAPLHVLPLLVVPLCGWLVGVYVWRETGCRTAALTATVVYVIHPATTMSVGPWIANQYHGFATICVLVTMILWQRCRERPLRAWAPLVVPIVIAGFTKEDALMLPLVLVTAQWALARWTGTVTAPTRPEAHAAKFVGDGVERDRHVGTAQDDQIVAVHDDREIRQAVMSRKQDRFPRGSFVQLPLAHNDKHARIHSRALEGEGHACADAHTMPQRS
jgi:hypothetical protein